ncbi:LytTR family DNA-binding domain-containing protein [Pseudozobellia sp. WGM2]|uniref:LytR/AlgR family response regulator transcription factor n=1 Tax=Pseudozobellia sp. WGM2 TaxID=2787625 RepID=UPI001ADFB593|nr:LytTR family DNA-binding domain-containing protein [Pseudozobellia sp. WGM2]
METRCIIVDDEPPALDLLASYIDRLDNFKLLGRFGNAIEAFNFMNANAVDLMFVDIQMPQMNGLELIKSLVPRPHVVITTAYREYAADGFDLAILDYLVKPVSFDRFLQSISRYSNSNNASQYQENSLQDTYMFFKVERLMVKIYLKDITYIESIHDYIKIITPDKTYITYTRIGFMDDKLPEGHFVRIHKSYIISLNKIESFRHDSVTVSGRELPVGRVFKQTFIKALENHKFFKE